MVDLYEKLLAYRDKLVGSNYSLFKGVLVCKVSGVTFDGKQEIVSRITKRTKLKLDRDRHNKYDFYAIKVLAFINKEWEEVGFIPSRINKQIASTIDAGVELLVKLKSKTGGYSDLTQGLLIEISRS